MRPHAQPRSMIVAYSMHSSLHQALRAHNAGAGIQAALQPICAIPGGDAPCCGPIGSGSEDLIVYIPAYKQRCQHNVQRLKDNMCCSRFVPFLAGTLAPIAAATSIQSAWRAYRTRQRLDLVALIRQRRAALAIQRWWRAGL